MHGYPPDWKFKKKGTGNTAYNAHNVQADHSSSLHTSMRDLPRDVPRAPPLTSDQHGHIQQMLDGDISTANVMANMAGPFQWEIEGDW